MLIPQKHQVLGAEQASVSSAVKWAWGRMLPNLTTLKAFPVLLWLIQPNTAPRLSQRAGLDLHLGSGKPEWETKA